MANTWTWPTWRRDREDDVEPDVSEDRPGGRDGVHARVLDFTSLAVYEEHPKLVPFPALITSSCD